MLPGASLARMVAQMGFDVSLTLSVIMAVKRSLTYVVLVVRDH